MVNFKNIDWKNVGLSAATGVIVIGSLVMYLTGGIFGKEVLDDLCQVELTSGENATDLNEGWKEFMDICIGVGAAPLVLLVLYLLIKALCQTNNMTFACILSAAIGGMTLGVSYADDSSVRYGLMGILISIAILGMMLGIKQPTAFQPYMIRLCAIGFLLFGGVVACCSASISKYNECQELRGCEEDEEGDMPACDATCTDPPLSTPCGSCQSCDLHTGIQDKLWIVNGTAIGMTTVCIAGLIASMVA